MNALPCDAEVHRQSRVDPIPNTQTTLFYTKFRNNTISPFPIGSAFLQLWKRPKTDPLVARIHMPERQLQRTTRQPRERPAQRIIVCTAHIAGKGQKGRGSSFTSVVGASSRSPCAIRGRVPRASERMPFEIYTYPLGSPPAADELCDARINTRPRPLLRGRIRPRMWINEGRGALYACDNRRW